MLRCRLPTLGCPGKIPTCTLYGPTIAFVTTGRVPPLASAVPALGIKIAGATINNRARINVPRIALPINFASAAYLTWFDESRPFRIRLAAAT